MAKSAPPVPDAIDDQPTGEWTRDDPTVRDPTLPTERRFLDHLSQRPDDAGMRMVFADWLEETGQDRKAALLRMIEDPSFADSQELRAASNAVEDAWLATVSRAPIEGCEVELKFRCPKQWSSLTPADNLAIRACDTCERNVYFCISIEEVRERARERQCVAFSSRLTRRIALDEYDAAGYILMGEVAATDEMEALADVDDRSS